MNDLEKAIDRFERATRALTLLNTNWSCGMPHVEAEREKNAARQKLLRVATRASAGNTV